MLCAVSHYIRHNGISETTLILIHQDWLAIMVYQVIFQITTKIGRREINFNTFPWVLLLNEFQWWHEVAISTDKDDAVGSIKYTIGYHPYRNIHIPVQAS